MSDMLHILDIAFIFTQGTNMLILKLQCSTNIYNITFYTIIKVPLLLLGFSFCCYTFLGNF